MITNNIMVTFIDVYINLFPEPVATYHDNL